MLYSCSSVKRSQTFCLTALQFWCDRGAFPRSSFESDSGDCSLHDFQRASIVSMACLREFATAPPAKGCFAMLPWRLCL